MNTALAFDVIIVPGSVRVEERRLRAIAAGFALEEKLAKNLILSGGITNLESESASMLETVLANYINIKTSNIYLDEDSKDTSANIENSLKIINKNITWKRVGILSNNYHKKRIKKIAKSHRLIFTFIEVDELLIEKDSKYKNIIDDYYNSKDMKSVLILENILNTLLMVDTMGKIPRKLSEIYYRFLK